MVKNKYRFGRRIKVGDYDAIIIGKEDSQNKIPVAYDTREGKANVYWIDKEQIDSREKD